MMVRIYSLISLVCLLVMGCGSSIAGVFKSTPYQVCFTPQQNCTALLVSLINHAHNDIKMQVYSFTSRPIQRALLKAAKKGVTVSIILDKSNFDGKHYSAISRLFHVTQSWDDDQLNIAHNKVMIIDRHIVQIGSFNYTTSAQRFNAENVLIIDNRQLASSYLKNWQYRRQLSKKVDKKLMNHYFYMRRYYKRGKHYYQ